MILPNRQGGGFIETRRVVEKLKDFSVVSFCGEGADTMTYKVIRNDGMVCALKIPRQGINTDDWHESQRVAKKNRQNYTSGYVGNICIPKCLSLGQEYCVEEFAVGSPLTYERYLGLSKEIRNHIVSDFSEFILNAHNRTLRNDRKEIDISNNWIDLKSGIDYLLGNGAISHAESDVFLRLADEYEKRETYDEVMCLTHRDYTENNLLFDDTSCRLSVLDFASSRMGCIYEDFIPAFNHYSLYCPYQFFADVISGYNDACGFECIQHEKVALHHYLAAINEIAAICFRQNFKQCQIVEMVQSILRPLHNRIRSTLK